MFGPVRCWPWRTHPPSIRTAITRRSRRAAAIELPGEVWGTLGRRKPEDGPDITAAKVAFGQSVAVTPTEMVQMYAAIANDGVLLPPTIIAAINGKPHHPRLPLRRVLSPEA